MKKTIEVAAKKLDDAIKQGLTLLGRENDDDVEIHIISQGGFFSKAKVTMTVEVPDEVKPVKEMPRASEKPQSALVKAERQDKHIQKGGASIPAERKEQKSATRRDEQKSAPSQPKPVSSQQRPERQIPVKKTDEQRAEHPRFNREPRTESPLTDEQKARALEFLRETVAKMGLSPQIECKENEGFVLDMTAEKGEDAILIGHRGETLDALQYITELALRVGEDKFIKLTLDCNGYRARRADELTRFAKKRAEEAAAKHRRIKLEPMDRNNRRTVHQALSEDERIVAVGEGKEPYRCIVIYPADMYKGGKRR